MMDKAEKFSTEYHHTVVTAL